MKPTSLLLLGHGENPIFELDLVLKDRFPALPVVPIIADIRDRVRLGDIFARHRPGVVLHAAAHKHVPLMEDHPVEAVTNNVLGTLHVVELSAEHEVLHLALVSTDKAVRATSVMGATKRVAEQIVQHTARRHRRHFVSVRFGNVIGTRGQRGAELPAADRGRRTGDGDPPRDAPLLHDLPRSGKSGFASRGAGAGRGDLRARHGTAGQHPAAGRDDDPAGGQGTGRDIAIEITGIRPGEKLYEEPYFSTEEAEPTEMPGILRARATRLPERFVTRMRALLRAAAQSESDEELRRCLAELVPDYAPSAG